MLNDANGGFIHFSVRWDYYEKATTFVLSTAHQFHLNCFDPQTSRFYPAKGPAVAVADRAAPVTNRGEAIKKAREVCGLTEKDRHGKWQAVLLKDPSHGAQWHVWYGKKSQEPVCDFYGAYVDFNGTTSCVVTKCKR